MQLRIDPETTLDTAVTFLNQFPSLNTLIIDNLETDENDTTEMKLDAPHLTRVSIKAHDWTENYFKNIFVSICSQLQMFSWEETDDPYNIEQVDFSNCSHYRMLVQGFNFIPKFKKLETLSLKFGEVVNLRYVYILHIHTL